ncbi:MAG TPA: flagellar biosynthesis anti-sigma factor FlgM [Bdellovibrionales bacterium]|nr:flagellar biosynthesis anti-sigma factor FlgM [Bdellovibrionales bacterium]
MKVTDKTNSALAGVAGSAVKKTEKNVQDKLGTVSKESISNSAKVDLSGRAQDIKKAKEIASQGLNDVDEAKVAKFRALIDGGQYKVNARAVADKLVDEHASTMRAENGDE